MTAVTQLGWLRSGVFAPILVADGKGYFEAAQFGIAASASIRSARASPSPIDVVAGATLYQDSPAALIRLADPCASDPTPPTWQARPSGRRLMAASISIHHVPRRFGSGVALRPMGLEVAAGEFIALTGPSGCGSSASWPSARPCC